MKRKSKALGRMWSIEINGTGKGCGLIAADDKIRIWRQKWFGHFRFKGPSNKPISMRLAKIHIKLFITLICIKIVLNVWPMEVNFPKKVYYFSIHHLTNSNFFNWNTNDEANCHFLATFFCWKSCFLVKSRAKGAIRNWPLFGSF